jgi:hypothetical protein
LPSDIEYKLNAWKKETLSDEFGHFTKAYQELLNILGYLNLDRRIAYLPVIILLMVKILLPNNIR